jgi:hypothetical protein
LRATRTLITGAAVVAVMAPAVAEAQVQTPGQPRTAAASKYKILKHLDYSGPGKVSLRLGYYNAGNDKGFGWRKVRDKHNIRKYSAVEFVAKSPNRKHIKGTKYHLTAWANKLRCVNGRCTVVKSQKVLLGVDERVPRGAQNDFGVVTMFCVGVQGKCQNWVTKALANSNRRATQADTASEAAAAHNSYRAGYHKLPAGSVVKSP